MNPAPSSPPPTPVLPYGREAAPGMLGFFAPDPPAAVQLTDAGEIREKYGRYQLRVLLWATVGYALFYFVRKNLSIAMPVMSRELGIGKPQLGMFLTLHGVLYGVSKFANGFLGDRSNARTFLATGLILSALCNVFFGVSSLVVVFGIAWMLNGWFQGMGSPPCSRLMAHWFAPRELATKMSIWNTSHSVGTIAGGPVRVPGGVLVAALLPGAGGNGGGGGGGDLIDAAGHADLRRAAGRGGVGRGERGSPADGRPDR